MRAYLLDSFQATKVISLLSFEEGFCSSTISCGSDESDKDNDVQTGFHFKISFE